MFRSFKSTRFVIAIITALLCGIGNQASPALADDSCDINQTRILNGCDFTGRDLRSWDLSNSTIQNSNFTDALLDNANLQNTDFTGSNFTQAQLNSVSIAGANFTNSTFMGVRAQNVVGSESAQLPPDWAYRSRWLVGPGVDLSWANLSYVNFEDINLSSANLYGVRFYGAVLTNANLSGARLEKSSLDSSAFNNANLSYADLRFARMYSANFGGANLSNTDFSNAYAHWSYFGGANFERALLRPFIGDGNTFSSNNFNGATIASNLPSIGRISGASFQNANLEGMDFSYQYISGFDFSGANLSNANFYRTFMPGTKFNDANLENATFTYANMSDVELANAQTFGLKATEIVGQVASLPADWRQINNFLAGPGARLPGLRARYTSFRDMQLGSADFTGSDLTGSDFSGSNLSRATLTRSAITGAAFNNTNLTNSTLNSTWVEGSDFSGATLTGVYSPQVNCQNAILPDHWVCYANRLVGPGADLTGAVFDGYYNSNYPKDLDLSHANLTNTRFAHLFIDKGDFRGAYLRFAYFMQVNLSNTNFESAVFKNANFTQVFGQNEPHDLNFARTRILDSTFSNTQFGGADFTDAIIQGSYFENFSAHLADFRNAQIIDSRFSGFWSFGSSITGLKSGGLMGDAYLGAARTLNGYVVGPEVDLRGANLADASFWDYQSDLTGTDLSFADLRRARFAHQNNLQKATIIGANFEGAYLAGLNFTGKDLSGLNMTGANLTGAVLTGANIAGLDLSGATLDGLVSGKLTGTPSSLPDDWHLVSGYLVGPRVNLQEADLSGFDLAGISLAGAQLSFADLTGTNLSSADLSNANLSYSNLRGASISSTNFFNANLTWVASGALVGGGAQLTGGFILTKGYLVGPLASLRGADLKGAQLSGQDFSSANLSGADLSGADLQNASFMGARLTSVNFSGSILSGAQFQSADLSNANLTSTYLFNSGFSGANIDGVNLSDSYIGSAHFAGVISALKISSGHVTGKAESLPVWFVLEKGYLVGPYSDLRNANLVGASLNRGNRLFIQGSDLTNANLSEADLGGVYLAGANLSSTNFARTNFHNAYLGGVSGLDTNFSGADLSCDDPCEANPLTLDHPNFSDANLVGRNFENSVITNSKFDGANLSNVNLNKANLSGSRFFGTNLSQAWLLYANLSGAKIVSSNLDRARMATATLDGVSSAGISGNPLALPTNWSLSSGSLVGPGSSVADVPRVELSVSSITGELAVGKTVSVTAETDVNNPAISYQWLLDNQAIGGAVSSTFTITSPIAGHVLTVRVSASKSGYSSSTATARTEGAAELSEFPALTNVSVSGASKLGESLRVSYTNKTEGSTIQIKVSHDGTTWLDAGSGYRPGLEDLGLALKVRVIQSAEGFADQFTDVDLPAISSVIPNAPCASGALDNSVALSAPAIVGVTKYSAKVSGSVGAWARGTKLCQFWLVDNAVSMTQATLKFKLGAAEVGKKIRFVVAATNGSGKTVLAASPEQLVQKLTFEVTQSPVISGNPMVGSVLKPVLGSSWGSQVTFTYQWFRNSQEILGATSSSLVLQAGDLGSTLKVRVCGSRANYETKCLDSTPTATVVTGVFATSPSLRIIGGPARAGTTLSVSSGNWLAGVSLRYQWLRDGSAITGETNMTHVVANADRGHSLTVQVTAAKPGFTDLVKTTAAKQIPGK